MSSESTILELVGLIYDAAGSPARWAVFLERLGKLLNAEANNILVQDVALHEGNPITCVGIDPAFQASYAAYYDTRNVYYIHGRHLLRPGVVCQSDQLCPPDIARKSEFYNDWMVPQRQTHALNGVILKEKTLTSMIGLIRLAGEPSFETEDMAVLRMLMPHLQRAVQLHQRITGLKMEQKAARDALNRWPLGVILLNEKGQVLLMNRSAEAIVNQRDGLILDRLGLRAHRANETTVLRELIQGAVQTATRRNGHAPGGAVLMPRPSGKRPLNVLVTPACANPLLFPMPGAATVIFVSDPEATEQPQEELLRAFYGLSHAESQVAALLLEAKRLPEIADGLAITVNTVKTHAKRIYEKTGTRGQGEFIRLVMRSPASIAARSGIVLGAPKKRSA